MRAYEVANAVSLAAAGSTTAINLDTAMNIPFVAGYDVVSVIAVAEAAPGTSIALETSPDNSTWTAVHTVVAADDIGVFYQEVKLDSYIRVTVVGTGTAGSVANVHLLGN